MKTRYPIHEDLLLMRNLPNAKFHFYIGHHTHRDYPVHHHEQFEISLVLNGTGRMLVNGIYYPLRPGTLVLLPPHSLHNFVTENDKPFYQLCCMFDFEIVTNALVEPELCDILLRLGEDLSPALQLAPDRFQIIHQNLIDILEEWNHSSFGRHSLILSKLTDVILQFIRQQPQLQDQRIPAPPKKNKDSWKLLQYVNMHYMEEGLTLEEVAVRFACSTISVNRILKERTGRGFTGYLNVLRIRRTLGLLSSTQMQVSDIATEVGFESLRTFSRVFKKLRGITPSEYRRLAGPLPASYDIS